MSSIIELGEDISYKYSFKGKRLIYWPQEENYIGNMEASVERYKSELTKLYQSANDDEDIHFIAMDSQMIQKAIDLTNQVIFEVTEKCNLSCTYCALGSTYKNVSVERCRNMDWQTAKSILDFYVQKWKNDRPKKFKKFCYIGFHGGEPLLNMKLIKRIISYIEKKEEIKELNFLYSMTTNGTLLHKHIEYLVEKNFILHVSMDGDREMNSYRVDKNGKEIYDDLYHNLKIIQSKYPQFFKENVEFLSVATNKNTNPGITSFFNKEFDKNSEIHLLSSTMVADYEEWESMRRKKDDTKSEKNDNKYLSDFLRLFSGNFYNHYRSLLDNPKTVNTLPTGTCIPFTHRVFITARKDIIACERIGFERKLGRVSDNGVELDLISIRDFYNNTLAKFKLHCERCFKKEACTVCFLTNEKYFDESFTCEDFYPVSHLKRCIKETVNFLRERAGKANNY
ncbi:MAG: radical SAM peptide maturase [Mariniphaga sp.]|nr:radical SAM peptide maturase [Mariniphaga sp.]